MKNKVNIKLIKNALFCMRGDDDLISFDDILNGRYNEELKTHMNKTIEELKLILSNEDWFYIKQMVDEENACREYLFS
jgi:hypothetical protein